MEHQPSSRHAERSKEAGPGHGSHLRLTRDHMRGRLLRSTAALPTLVTLGNGVAGFAAIHFATKPLPVDIIAAGAMAAEAWVGRHLVLASWMLLVAMFCDALDGRLARMTRHSTDFGGQLDSLCDAVSFGVAPAILMLRAVQNMVQNVLFPFVGEVDVGARAYIGGRLVWFIAAVYASCAILRLARFNVENEHDESHHRWFEGLPSPAAALAVASLVLLHAHLGAMLAGWNIDRLLDVLAVWALPAVTLTAGVLMVSRLPYPHVINQYLRGGKSFGAIVRIAVAVLAAIVVDFRIALATCAMLYLLSGPVRGILASQRRSTQATS